MGIKATINSGLSQELIKSFPDLVAVTRPLVEVTETFDPAWLAGFTDG
jgi:hypothetical protein